MGTGGSSPFPRDPGSFPRDLGELGASPLPPGAGEAPAGDWELVLGFGILELLPPRLWNWELWSFSFGVGSWGASLPSSALVLGSWSFSSQFSFGIGNQGAFPLDLGARELLWIWELGCFPSQYNWEPRASPSSDHPCPGIWAELSGSGQAGSPKSPDPGRWGKPSRGSPFPGVGVSPRVLLRGVPMEF